MQLKHDFNFFYEINKKPTLVLGLDENAVFEPENRKLGHRV